MEKNLQRYNYKPDFQKHEISFGKTSAKNGEGVEEIFEILLDAINAGKEIKAKKGEHKLRQIPSNKGPAKNDCKC